MPLLGAKDPLQPLNGLRHRRTRATSRHPRNSTPSTRVATTTKDGAVPASVSRRSTMPTTKVSSQTRMPTLIMRGSSFAYAAHASASAVPTRKGQAVCQTPAFGDATDFDQIKQHYYRVQDDINPSGIVPKGPDTSGWLSPHGREALSDA